MWCTYDFAVISYLELMQQPYTGCNPRGLLLSKDKALSKKVLSFHRIPTPRFTVFPIGRTVHRPKKLVVSAVRQIGGRGCFLWNRPGIDREQRRSACRTGQVRSREDRRRRDRGTVHRGTRVVRRRDRQHAPEDSSGLGNELRQNARRHGQDRHQPSEMEQQVSRETRDHNACGDRCRRCDARANLEIVQTCLSCV